MTNERRIAVEDMIRDMVIDTLVSHGLPCTIDNGEEEPISFTLDRAALIAASKATDEERVVVDVSSLGGAYKRSSVTMIYGNGWDTIADNGGSLENILTPIFDKVRQLQDNEAE